MSEKRALTPEREEQPAEAARHVEPQPQSDEKSTICCRRAAEQSSDIDSYLRAVADNITDNEVIEDLGRELGFSRGDIRNFIRTNYRDDEITSHGTFCMLRKWSERVSQSSLRSDLKEALKRAEEPRTARAHLQSAGVSEGKSTCLTPDEVLQLKKELVRRYQSMCSAVRTSPLYCESSISLDDIYTNLAMFSKCMMGEKTDIKYDDFIKHLENICASKESKNGTVLFGEAGVGKTTFLAKLTLDWASGKCLEAIELLFLIPLREIEENTSFGDIISKISDEVEFDGPRVEEYIRKNQRKVLILCDGLDEYSKDMDGNALKDDIIAVLTGNKYKYSPVVVTTRPWRAMEIKSSTELEKRYKFVEIEGFKKEDVKSYIAKFFPDNKEAKDGLIRLMTDKDSLVAENMTPHPIFCSMLCFIWQNEGSRSVIQGLETLAQLFEELIHHLNEHYAGKEKRMKKQVEKLKQGIDSLQQFGKDALYCLLKNKLVLEEDDLETCLYDLKIGCEIGVLAREEASVYKRENNRRRTDIVVKYRIPHKLFQEYLAGAHLAWLYETNREEFNRLNNQLLKHYRCFEHLLYFTVAHNREVGRAVLSSFWEMYHGNITACDVHDFFTNIAFECHDLSALEPMIPFLNKMTSLDIEGSGHTARGWIFVFKACGYFASNRSNHSFVTSTDDTVESAAQTGGRGSNILSNLVSLRLNSVRLDDDFFTTLAFLAPQLLQLREMRHAGGPDISAAASQAYAKSICTMPNLKTLELCDVKIADEFFAALAASALEARLKLVSHTGGPDISATASQAYAQSICTMPNLKTLELHDVKIEDEFFSALAASASEAKLREMRHAGGPDISAAASQAYAKSICTMPNLKTLELCDVKIADEFFAALAASALEARLKLVSHTGGPDISATASQAYAQSICTMPNLKTLELHDVKIEDEFFSALAASASEAKLKLVSHTGGPDVSAAASEAYAKSICTMPNLRVLELHGVNLTDGFFSAVKSSASKIQLESISHTGGPPLSASASRAYAKSICTMPNLQTLELVDVGITGDFFVVLADSALGARLQSLSHTRGPPLSASASKAYAKSICMMPNLQTLELQSVSMAEEFYVALAASASTAKLASISHIGRPPISMVSARASRDYAKSICSMKSLQTLELKDVGIEEDFFVTLAESASRARLQSIIHHGGPGLSDTASYNYGKSICAMPNLQSLELNSVIMTDSFVFALSSSASDARLQSISHTGGSCISDSASRAYAESICDMRSLQTLDLQDVRVTDMFFFALAASASKARLESLSHTRGPDISSSASQDYAKSICNMLNLQTLELQNVSIADDFWVAFADSTSSSRLTSISHTGGPPISATVSRAYAKSICSMRSLKTLELKDVGMAEDFFIALAESAPRAMVPSAVCV
ncbi:uncharacterized protein [Diadema setosum]|uniref:uncharacterized protein n=1 Tax=Diadema setosum TaxID=31175 RepID=UPI003B3B12D6